MKWKNAKENPPKKNGFYNVVLETDNGEIAHSCWYKDGTWYYDNYLYEGEPLYAMGWYASVILWRKMPKLPE